MIKDLSTIAAVLVCVLLAFLGYAIYADEPLVDWIHYRYVGQETKFTPRIRLRHSDRDSIYSLSFTQPRWVKVAWTGDTLENEEVVVWTTHSKNLYQCTGYDSTKLRVRQTEFSTFIVPVAVGESRLLVRDEHRPRRDSITLRIVRQYGRLTIEGESVGEEFNRY